MTIVEKSGGQYHVLLIIADGQVSLLHISFHSNVDIPFPFPVQYIEKLTPEICHR